MGRKVVKRRKIKIFAFLIFLLILAILSLLIYLLLSIPIKNINIKNTTYLKDDYILKLANIYDYPSFFLTSKKDIENKLLKSKYINKVDVNKKFFNIIELNVYENIPLFYNDKGDIVFSNNTSIKTSDDFITHFRIPRLVNYIPDNKYKTFIKRMSQVDKKILIKISDIEYQPNDYDKDRFLLYMDDGNMVYLTLTKFKHINYYNSVISKVENKKGILYLDNGNHFQIME